MVTSIQCVTDKWLKHILVFTVFRYCLIYFSNDVVVIGIVLDRIVI